MLSVLHIENIAVIELAEIVFDRGFQVLTGETGTGKSIIIDAISAIIGERAYRDMIRTGCNKAFVSAVFTQVPELPWFSGHGVPYDPEELLVQREVFADGKNVCRVNGTPVTVTILRQLGMQLINIHGQHDSQQLFDETSHLRFLDSFAGNDALLETYHAAYETVQQLRHEIARLSMDETEKARRVEMLRYQVAEIERADLQPGEDEQLDARRKVLQNAEKLAAGVNEAELLLSGDEDSDGACAMLTRAARAVAGIARYTDELESLHGQLNDAMYTVQDLADQLRDLRDHFAFSGDELEQIEERLHTISMLRRKYGADVGEILSYLEQARAELDEITFAGDRIEQLQVKLKKQEQLATDAAMALRSARQKAAKALEGRIAQELAELAMPKVRFQCEFEEASLSPDGMDVVRFLMSANLGEALKPLSKVASGGELARIMLAMKNVLAERDAVATLIFDEVDTGVSGRAAQKVGEKLRAVAQGKQVLCVTHLPQIAALAQTHFLISKAEKDGRTYTSVERLAFEGRRAELARMIGGATITETTLRSAEEMLNA